MFNKGGGRRVDNTNVIVSIMGSTKGCSTKGVDRLVVYKKDQLRCVQQQGIDRIVVNKKGVNRGVFNKVDRHMGCQH